jgi:hypothetical protein
VKITVNDRQPVENATTIGVSVPHSANRTNAVSAKSRFIILAMVARSPTSCAVKKSWLW